MSACRGVVTGSNNGTLTFDTRCVDTDYYTSVDIDGSCDDTAASGAYAGQVKTTSLCSGGSCLAGTGSLIYQTTYEYDGHRRTCSVQSENNDQALILGATYSYDQYGNIIQAMHESELDTSTASNNQVAYGYDGMMRLVAMNKSDLDGNPLESISYKYDSRSNITKKVQTTFEPPADLSLTSPHGRATRVGTGKPGRIVVAGTVQVAEPIDLTQIEAVELHETLKEGDTELVMTHDGAPLAPLTLDEKKISTLKKAVFLLEIGDTKVRLKLKQHRDKLKVKIRAKEVLVSDPASCSGGAQETSALETRFHVHQRTGEALTLELSQPWKCKGKKLKP